MEFLFIPFTNHKNKKNATEGGMKSCTHRSNRTPNQIDPLHHLAVGSTTPFAKNGVPNLYLKILNRISTRFVASLETMRASGKDGKVVRESINICCRALGINNKVEAPNNPPPHH